MERTTEPGALWAHKERTHTEAVVRLLFRSFYPIVRMIHRSCNSNLIFCACLKQLASSHGVPIKYHITIMFLHFFNCYIDYASRYPQIKPILK